MRVLITGSSGQIGTNLAQRLLQRGDEVVGIDRRHNPWDATIATTECDLLTLAAKGKALPLNGRFDAIVHLAAHAKVHELVQQPTRAFENVAMLGPVLEAARVAAGGPVPVILGSSREVYGDVDRTATAEANSDGGLIAESPYSASKIAAEAFVDSYRRCYDLPTMTFRFSNVYGRYDNDEERMQRVIPLFVRRIAQGEPITVYGRDKTLDFTYVDDCVAGIAAGLDALVANRCVGNTYNLAFGEGHSLAELVDRIAGSVGREPIVDWQLPLRGEVTRYVADVGRARRDLGYEPRVSLAEGIPRYVAWCRSIGFIPAKAAETDGTS